MSLAENVEMLPQPLGGNYEVARFNALRHGVLSRHGFAMGGSGPRAAGRAGD